MARCWLTLSHNEIQEGVLLSSWEVRRKLMSRSRRKGLHTIQGPVDRALLPLGKLPKLGQAVGLWGRENQSPKRKAQPLSVTRGSAIHPSWGAEFAQTQDSWYLWSLKSVTKQSWTTEATGCLSRISVPRSRHTNIPRPDRSRTFVCHSHKRSLQLPN